MRILFLLKHTGVERMTVFIEVIKELIEKGVDIHIVIGDRGDDYFDECYYNGKTNIRLDILEKRSFEEKAIGSLKRLIGKCKAAEKITWTVLFFFTQWIFWIKYLLLNRKKKDYVFEKFLTPVMREYKLQKDYDYIWTTDEFGLLWAEWINQHSEKQYKIIHHSYELYWEHYSLPLKKHWRYFKEYVLFEGARKILPKVSLFIIQDEARWEVFCHYTGINKKSKKVLFPVAIRDYPLISQSDICERMDINVRKKIIFYPTYIAPERGCVELVRMAQELDESYIALLHGFVIAKNYVDEIRKNILNPARVLISSMVMDYQDLIEFHHNVWCVFLCYGETDNNNKYIVNSSNKLAMALQAGKPIITIGNRMLAALCSEYRCGIAIDGWFVEEFCHAVYELEQNYEFYCNNARRCFEQRFNIKLFSDGLLNELAIGL